MISGLFGGAGDAIIGGVMEGEYEKSIRMEGKMGGTRPGLSQEEIETILRGMRAVA